MDWSTPQERERVVQQERADARKRVQAAQDKEITTRVEKRAEKQRRADERARAHDGDVSAASAARNLMEREGVEGGEGDSSLQTNVAST